MSQIVLDYLMVVIAIVVSWKMYYAAHPPPADGGSEPAVPPLLAEGLSAVSWTKLDLPQNVAPQLGETLRRICVASGYPAIGTFIDGAKLTYETVIEAFAKGDMEPQAYLLSRVVRETFDEAIAAREKRGETVELTFIGFRASDIVDAGIDSGRAWIDVRFVGEMVSVTRDGEGRVVVGEPGRVIDIAEIWTFERELRSAEPFWLLTGTDADE